MGDGLPEPVLRRLRAAYGAEGRRYHGLAHVEDCLRRLADVPGLAARERRLLAWALWFHDAVYDPRRSDNEAKSADLAEAELESLGVPAADVAEVGRLIRLTTGHEVREGDRLGAILVSIDLAILGSAPTRYDAYAAAIRAEYGHVPEDAYRRGRGHFLERMLASPAIFPDPAFRRDLEDAARANLARELASLRP
ncbi:MAG: phosphohydrolase [Myxococcota bacterium]